MDDQYGPSDSDALRKIYLLLRGGATVKVRRDPERVLHCDVIYDPNDGLLTSVGKLSNQVHNLSSDLDEMRTYVSDHFRKVEGMIERLNRP